VERLFPARYGFDIAIKAGCWQRLGGGVQTNRRAMGGAGGTSPDRPKSVGAPPPPGGRTVAGGGGNGRCGIQARARSGEAGGGASRGAGEQGKGEEVPGAKAHDLRDSVARKEVGRDRKVGRTKVKERSPNLSCFVGRRLVPDPREKRPPVKCNQGLEGPAMSPTTKLTSTRFLQVDVEPSRHSTH